MQSTDQSRTSGRRRWARIVGTGTTALVAAAALSSTAGAATTRRDPRRVRSQRQRGGAERLELEHGGAEPQFSGQTTVNWTSTTQFSKTVTEPSARSPRRLRHCHRHAVEEVQDDHRGPLHHRLQRHARAARVPVS